MIVTMATATATATFRPYFIIVLRFGLLSLGLLSGPVFARSIPVKVTPVIEQAVAEELQLIGTLEALETIGIASSVTERITKLHFNDGDTVVVDQVLAELDSSEEMALLSEAQSVLKEAQQQLARLEPLVKKGASPKSALDTARQEMLSAQSRVRVIEARLDQHTIKAPFAGQLGLRQVSRGALVQTGQVLAFLDAAGLKIRLAVPVGYLNALQAGATLELPSYPTLGKVKISSQDTQVQPNQTLWVYGILNEAATEVYPQLQPGLKTKTVLRFTPKNGLVVPETAVVLKGKNAYVFILNELHAEASLVDAKPTGTSVQQIEVNLGIRANGLIEIKAGLNANNVVVSQGAQQLKNGDMVIYAYY